MNRSHYLLLIAIIFSAFSCRQDDGEAQREKLRNIVLEYYNALSNKDLQKANSLTTGNFVLWDEGRVYNNAIAIDSVKQMPVFRATFTIDS